jgi:DNA-binding HxlR family transcriptional regulator
MTSITSQRARFRAPEILSVLKDHGQLTPSTLNKMISPRMSSKKLSRALERLREKGLIEKRGGEFRKPYYFLSQAPGARIAVSRLLRCHPDELIQPLLKRKDWYHQELCEYWIFTLKRIFPNAEFVRDRKILSHELASSLMLADRDGYDLFPDFLMIFEKEEGRQTVGVAVEIERTRKSNDRLMRKLKSYMCETRIDGLLYVCDSGRLSDTIRVLYAKTLEGRWIRGGHYGDFYFLFSDSIETHEEPLSRIFNARGEQLNLSDWIMPMLSTKWTLRRNEMFARRGSYPLAEAK